MGVVNIVLNDEFETQLTEFKEWFATATTQQKNTLIKTLWQASDAIRKEMPAKLKQEYTL